MHQVINQDGNGGLVILIFVQKSILIFNPRFSSATIKANTFVISSDRDLLKQMLNKNRRKKKKIWVQTKEWIKQWMLKTAKYEGSGLQNLL